MDIYSHELSAYERECIALKKELTDALDDINQIDNLTHFSIGISNRGHMMIIGLCSLVEALLYELAFDEEKKQHFMIKDLKNSGIWRLKKYLSRTKRVDFQKVRNWDKFKNIYTLRNVIVHSYGGFIEISQLDDVKNALRNLKIENALIGNKRIRVPPDKLFEFHSIISDVINTLQDNKNNN